MIPRQNQPLWRSTPNLTREAIVNQVTLNVNLSFGYFWVGKFPYANA